MKSLSAVRISALSRLSPVVLLCVAITCVAEFTHWLSMHENALDGLAQASKVLLLTHPPQ